MNPGGRTRLQPKKVPVKDEVEKMDVQGTKQTATNKAAKTGQDSTTQKKLSLQQHVDKLKKKLRYEENVHRALERALNRPLGALPRLPPYLPAPTLELLAGVAVLEEEVVKLEEQVVHFRQDVIQEAVYISSTNRIVVNFADLHDESPKKDPERHKMETIVKEISEPNASTVGHLSSVSDGRGKQNQLCTNSVKNRSSSMCKAHPSKTPVSRHPMENQQAEQRLDPQKLQLKCTMVRQENEEAINASSANKRPSGDDSPNEISEDIVKCLSNIFIRMGSCRIRRTAENLPILTSLISGENGEKTENRDPYGICSEFGKKDIGPYKHLLAVEAGTLKPSRTSNSLLLHHRLKFLLGKLASVELQNLTHQEKLAFWINIYNSCMMKAFLEHGQPESPETVVALMRKARINVGGHSLNAITIEHFILRLPYHLKYVVSKRVKNDEMTARSKFRLDLFEPLVTFALSCGSWSSPA